MADRNMINYGKTVANPQKFVGKGQYGGTARPNYDEIVTDGTETMGSKIFLGYLNPNETFLDGYISFGAMGSSTTLKIGDEEDDDRFLAATSVAAAGTANLRADTGVGFVNTSNIPMPLFATVGGATLAASQPLKAVLFITRD